MKPSFKDDCFAFFEALFDVIRHSFTYFFCKDTNKQEKCKRKTRFLFIPSISLFDQRLKMARFCLRNKKQDRKFASIFLS